jgi:hypothetical protein
MWMNVERNETENERVHERGSYLLQSGVVKELEDCYLGNIYNQAVCEDDLMTLGYCPMY